MGMAGPLVCYQVEGNVKSVAKADFEQLKTVATILDQTPPDGVNYSSSYVGSKYAYRNSADQIEVHRERGSLRRPTLLGLFGKVNPEFFAVLVPNIDDFLDCDPYLAASLARMNLNFGLQILSMRVRVKSQFVEKIAITPDKLLLRVGRGKALSNLMWANSRVCQAKSEAKLRKLAKTEDPVIVRIKNSGGDNQTLLAQLRKIDSSFDDLEPKWDPPFERKRA